MTSNRDERVDAEVDQSGLSRRKFIGGTAVGAGALAATTVTPGLLGTAGASEGGRGSGNPWGNGSNGRGQITLPQEIPGLRPQSAQILGRYNTYNDDWTRVPAYPFGGYDFAMGYMAEGVQGADPESPNFPNGQFSNTSGLFEHFSLRGIADRPIAADTGEHLGDVPSGVGGNEIASRSTEYWSRDILGQSNEAIRDDMWSAINWMRRVWGMDFDDPAVDGIEAFGYPYQYPGSPDAGNDYSLFSPRYAAAFDEYGRVTGFARFAPTLLGPDTSYTVIFRAGHEHPTYSGGAVINGVESRTTASSPDWPGKVRDGGFWGGIVQAMDVLPDIQAVRRGERYFTTPSDPAQPLSGTTPPNPNKRGQYGGATTQNPQGTGPYWGQWWRRVAPIVGIDVDDPELIARHPSIDATTDINTAANPDLNIPGTYIPARPAARPRWPIGFWPRNTDFFWGNYNLNFGEDDDQKITLHYQSEIPTDFRPSDGVPEAFLCDLCPNPGSAEINERADMDAGTGIQLFDSTGEISGFPDVSNPELDGQMSFGAPGFYGRVHGTSYPRSKRKDGIVTYHFRNYLLWPPRLNVTVLGDPTQENFGNVNWTIPARGDLAAENPFPITPFN